MLPLLRLRTLRHAEPHDAPSVPVPRRGPRWILTAAAALLIGVVSMAGGFALGRRRGVITETLAPPSTADSQSLTTAGSVASLRTRLSTIAGVSVLEQDEALLTTIEAQVFDSGDVRLSAQGVAALRGVADALAGQRVLVVVEGRTDERPVRPGGRWMSNWALALARATAAADELRQQGLPSSRLALASAPGGAGSRSGRCVALRLVPE